MTQTKTLAYIRVSTMQQVNDGFSLQNQKDRISAYCKFNNLGEPQIFSDEGISGRHQKRPALQEIISLIESKGVEHIVIYSLSRLGRNTVQTLQLIEHINKKGITLHSITEKLDTSSAMGKFFATTISAIAQLESDLTSERIVSVKQNQKSKRQTYCKQLTGFKNTYDITPEGKRINGRLEPTEHLETVKTIFKLHDKGYGKGAYAIATRLNRDGVKSMNNGKFYQSSILSILNNPIYKESVEGLK